MSAWTARVVSLALLAVLAGGPALAAVCTTVCEPAIGAAAVRGGDAHHQASALECHDQPASDVPRVGSSSTADCDTHHEGQVDGLSLAATRADLWALHLDVAPGEPNVLVLAPQASRAPSARASSVAPPRPGRTSLVLRI